jgi:hypothetical protein
MWPALCCLWNHSNWNKTHFEMEKLSGGNGTDFDLGDTWTWKLPISSRKSFPLSRASKWWKDGWHPGPTRLRKTFWVPLATLLRPHPIRGKQPGPKSPDQVEVTRLGANKEPQDDPWLKRPTRQTIWSNTLRPERQNASSENSNSH